MGKKNSNYNGKSGGAGFLITLGAAYLLFHGIPGIVLGVLLGAGVGFVASVVGKKLDTTTHNKEDVERERQEAARREAAAAQERARQAAEQQRKAAMEVPLTGAGQAENDGTGGIRITQMGCPMNLSKCPPRYSHAGYPEGYHTEEVLTALGYSEVEIREMT